MGRRAGLRRHGHDPAAADRAAVRRHERPTSLLAVLAGHPEQTAYEIVRQYWKRGSGGDEFEKQWRRAVHDGVVRWHAGRDA